MSGYRVEEVFRPKNYLSGFFSDFEELFRSCAVGTKLFEPGERIYGMSEHSSKYSYYLVKGTSKLSSTDENGHEDIWTLHGPGMILPLYYSHAGTTPEAITTFEAVSKVETLVVPKDDIARIMLEYPQVSIAMVDAWACWAWAVLYRLQSLNFPHDVRLCGFLQVTCDEESGILKIKQHDLARMVGASRERVNKALRELEANGIIELGRGTIRILSREGLEERAFYVANL